MIQCYNLAQSDSCPVGLFGGPTLLSTLEVRPLFIPLTFFVDITLKYNTVTLDGSKSKGPRKNFEGSRFRVFRSSECSELTDWF